MIQALISLLVACLVLGIVFYVLQRVAALLGAPSFVIEILKLIMLLIGLLYVLQLFGLVGAGFPVVRL